MISPIKLNRVNYIILLDDDGQKIGTLRPYSVEATHDPHVRNEVTYSIEGVEWERYEQYWGLWQAQARLPRITNVIFNGPATIVFWTDNTKTVVKCQEGDDFDPEKGLAMAISKKYFGNKSNYCNIFKKWLPEEEEVTVESVLKASPSSINELGKEIVNAVNRNFKRMNKYEQYFHTMSFDDLLKESESKFCDKRDVDILDLILNSKGGSDE